MATADRGKSGSDDRRWTLTRSHPMTTSLGGPQLALAESVEVVPVDQLEDALDALDRLAAISADEVTYPDAEVALDRIEIEALAVLRRFGRQARARGAAAYVAPPRKDQS